MSDLVKVTEKATAGQSNARADKATAKSTRTTTEIPGKVTSTETTPGTTTTTTTTPGVTVTEGVESTPERITLETRQPTTGRKTSLPFTVIQTQTGNNTGKVSAEDEGISVSMTLILNGFLEG